MGSKTIESETDPLADEIVESKPVDKVSKELANIRKRRNSDSGRRFPSALEDWTLLAGLGYGALYAMLLFGMSSGILENRHLWTIGRATQFLTQVTNVKKFLILHGFMPTLTMMWND